MKISIKKFITILVTISLIFILASCGNKSNPGTNSTQPTVTGSQSSSTTGITKTFTKAELAKYDGQNGNPAYVAVGGIVYDVSSVGSWSGGQHHGNQAGTDLTNAIKKSPHGTSVLKGLSVVGKYIG